MNPADVRQFNERLRRRPSQYSVAGSLPILFFGDLYRANVATVGLNPSHQEYLNRERHELVGERRRFETLASLDAADRQSLTDDDCARAIQTMRDYYRPGKPVYSWFRAMNRVLDAMGLSYQAGNTAHLNLVQEATDPAWSPLQTRDPGEAQALLSSDLPFLSWQITSFPIDLMICNGRTVFEHVRQLIDGQIEQSGTLRRITWYTGSGNAGGRGIKLAGWNIPLARPTGLGIEGERALGALLGTELGSS